MKLLPLRKSALFAKVDDEDYEYLAQFEWRLQPCTLKPDKFYVVRSGFKCRGTIQMHREVMKAKRGQEIDHRNSDGLDNQKLNLRFCTHQQNQCNQRKQDRSLYKGVSFHKPARKFRARIHVHGQEIYLGLFVNPRDAALAYNDAAAIHFGEFARLNEL